MFNKYETLLTGKHILVVEDNAINQMLLKHTLTKSGAKITIACNGLEALQVLKNTTADLILMDIQMPELDGYQTTQIIRKELQLGLPIVAMTALALHGEEQKCIAAGMNGYMSKPFSLEVFYQTLQKVFSEPEAVFLPRVISNGDLYLDIENLLKITGNDAEYLQTLVSSFITGLEKSIIKLENCIAVQKWDQVQTFAQQAMFSLEIIQSRQIKELLLHIEWACTHNTEKQLLSSWLMQLKRKTLIAKELLHKNFKIVNEEAMVA